VTADYAGLEARVSELERQMKHELPYRIDAISFAVGLVHQDTVAMRATLDEHTARLDDIDTGLDRQAAQLDRQGGQLDDHTTQLGRHGEMLEEILRRLPPGPAN
jgi:hypothetical protein